MPLNEANQRTIWIWVGCVGVILVVAAAMAVWGWPF